MPKHPGFGGLHGLSVKAQPPAQHPTDVALAPPLDPPAQPATRTSVEAGKGTTVHLTKAAAKELKKLAADRETTVHALMIEGINLVFKQYGIAHTAAAGPRPEAARKLASKKVD